MAQKRSSAASNPTIIVVPGAACRVVFYNGLVQRLISNGYDAHTYDLLTASREPPQEPATLAEDAKFFHDKIEALANAGRDVVVVAHSYGGMVATDAVQGLAKTDRVSQGLAGGVVRIIYLTCIVAGVGQTAGELTAHLDFKDFMEAVGEVCSCRPLAKQSHLLMTHLAERGILRPNCWPEGCTSDILRPAARRSTRMARPTVAAVESLLCRQGCVRCLPAYTSVVHFLCG